MENSIIKQHSLFILIIIFITGCRSIETVYDKPKLTLSIFHYLGKNIQGYEEYEHKQTGMIFVKIPAGEFMMGSNDGEDDEKPLHKVKLNSFLIGKHEVTRKQWGKIMENNPSFNKKGNNYPVERVSWYEAQEFCKRTGLRLPTEAEWEYACRAKTKTKYYWGETVSEDHVWYEGNSNRSTHPVGEKHPNNYGLYDMLGNVDEYCNDWYNNDYYKYSPIDNPKGPLYGKYRVVRGGVYISSEAFLRVAGRSTGGKGCFTGFRCVSSLDIAENMELYWKRQFKNDIRKR